MVFKKLSPLLLFGFLPLQTLAEEPAGTISAGAKLGVVFVDASAVDGLREATGWDVDIDAGLAYGLHADYKINQNWYVEAEYVSATAEVDFSGADGSGSEDVDLSSIALYGTYRSDGQVYLIGKLGVIRQSAKVDGFKESSAGVSFGVGAGYRVHEKFSIEGEFTSIDKDAAFVGLTGRYHF